MSNTAESAQAGEEGPGSLGPQAQYRSRYRLVWLPRHWLTVLRNRLGFEGKPLTENDPIWDIVGMGSSTGPGDVSENKHNHLAERTDAE